MTDTPQVLLAHHLKTLKLPTFLREYDKIARQCASEGVDHVRYLLRLAELELIDRERRMVERRIKAARFPVVKSLDSFDFKVIPSLNKALVLELARCEYIERRENLIALGNSGTGKTHIALGLGLAACQKGLSVGFITAAALVHELIEARDDKQLLRFQKKLATYKLLIVDELGFVPLSKTGAELLFEVFSQRYERGSTLVTTNLPFDEWTEVFGSRMNSTTSRRVKIAPRSSIPLCASMVKASSTGHIPGKEACFACCCALCTIYRASFRGSRLICGRISSTTLSCSWRLMNSRIERRISHEAVTSLCCAIRSKAA